MRGGIRESLPSGGTWQDTCMGLETGNPYSFMVSYFYYPALGYDGFRILNIARDDTGEFFSDAQGLNYTALGEDSLDIRATLMYGTSESWIYQTDTSGKAMPFDYEINASATGGWTSIIQRGLEESADPGRQWLFQPGCQQPIPTIIPLPKTP